MAALLFNMTKRKNMLLLTSKTTKHYFSSQKPTTTTTTTRYEFGFKGYVNIIKQSPSDEAKKDEKDVTIAIPTAYLSKLYPWLAANHVVIVSSMMWLVLDPQNLLALTQLLELTRLQMATSSTSPTKVFEKMNPLPWLWKIGVDIGVDYIFEDIPLPAPLSGAAKSWTKDWLKQPFEDPPKAPPRLYTEEEVKKYLASVMKHGHSTSDVPKELMPSLDQVEEGKCEEAEEGDQKKEVGCESGEKKEVGCESGKKEVGCENGDQTDRVLP